MQIALVVAEFRRRLQCRLMSRRLDRMVGNQGPESYRTPEFLAAEVELAIALALWAEALYALRSPEQANPTHARAEQIYTALLRFLPRADLGPRERMVIEKRFESLQQALASLQDRCTTA